MTVVSVDFSIMTFPNVIFENISSSSMLEEKNKVDVMTVLSSVIASVGARSFSCCRTV